MPDRLSEEALQQIKARAEAATLDPWLPGAMTVTDALAAAREDVPKLVAEVQRLRAIVYCDNCGREKVGYCSGCDNDE